MTVQAELNWRVHIMGPPDPPRALDADERYCFSEDKGQHTIFHGNSERIGFLYYRCPDCGETDGVKV